MTGDNSSDKSAKKKRGAEPWLLKQEGLTQQQWKSRKRREAKALERAFNVFRMGCAHTPLCNSEILVLQQTISSIRKQLSVKEWGQ